MSTKIPECWASDSQVEGLRIELSTDHSLLLPFNQFVLAELKILNNEHHFRMVFVMHEIVISGQNLKRIQIALQKKELAFIAKISGNYKLPALDGSPLIQSIVVTEVKAESKNPN